MSLILYSRPTCPSFYIVGGHVPLWRNYAHSERDPALRLLFASTSCPINWVSIVAVLLSLGLLVVRGVLSMLIGLENPLERVFEVTGGLRVVLCWVFVLEYIVGKG